MTNGNDSGAGSLRIALEGDTGTRQIVIRTDDDIELSSAVTCSDDANITLVSEGNGAITGASVIFDNVDNLLIYNCRFRPGLRGDENQTELDSKDAITLIDCDGFALCNNVFAWSVDELVDIDGSSNGTIYANILHEALESAGHTSGDHSYGILLTSGWDTVSIIGNLIAHCADRLPAMTTTGNSGARSSVEVAGNVIYNSKSPISAQPNEGPLTFAVQGNTRVAGPDTPTNPTDFDVGLFLLDSGASLPDDQYVASCVWYEDDNTAPDTPFTIEYPEAEGHVDWPSEESSAPSLSGYTPMSRTDAYAWVLANAGTTNRDSHEQRVVADVGAGTGSVIDDPSEVA